jgi:serine/threonine-protein kinase RsbW
MPADQALGLAQVGAATVPSGPEAPLLARTGVSRWLKDVAHAEMSGDAGLLVSELVTNSVRHAGQPAGAPVDVRATAHDGIVRVEVQDHGHGPVRARDPGSQHGGFGLRLVELIAARWGVSHEHGTCVWFELAASSPGT